MESKGKGKLILEKGGGVTSEGRDQRSASFPVLMLK